LKGVTLNNLFGKLMMAAGLVGVFASLLFAHFTFAVVVALAVGLGLIGFFGYNIWSDGGLMVRTKDSHSRRDSKGLAGGIMGFAIGLLLLGTGRVEIGAIGAALIVIFLLIGVFVVVVSPGKRGS
jgi:phosphoglycerol transferase MdoB-like AlkP superfamily enzyme